MSQINWLLTTNDFDPRAARVPVAVEGLVAAGLTARPSPLMFGVVEAGQAGPATWWCRVVPPFHILARTIARHRFHCKLPADAKAAHILPVTFLAKDASSSGDKLSAQIVIETDLAGAKAIELTRLRAGRPGEAVGAVAARRPSRHGGSPCGRRAASRQSRCNRSHPTPRGRTCSPSPATQHARPKRATYGWMYYANAGAFFMRLRSKIHRLGHVGHFIDGADGRGDRYLSGDATRTANHRGDELSRPLASVAGSPRRSI